MAELLALSDDRVVKDDSARRRVVAEGDRYEVTELLDGRYQVNIGRGDCVVQHVGPPEVIRSRVSKDSDNRDKAALAAAIPSEPGATR